MERAQQWNVAICTLWYSLEAAGSGANLQHYNPSTDTGIGEAFGAGKECSLKAQMVFGKAEGGRKM